MAEDAPPRRLSPAREPSRSSPVLRGDTIGRYVILEELGRGGMGAVHAAWDTDLGRRVALKLLLSQDASEQRRVRLRREAQAMARLSHPNVVTVYDVGTHEGRTFIAMELIDGGTLGKWLQQAQHSLAEKLRVLVEAGRGLSAAHAAGLVHRDFKPGNVLIGKDGRVAVTDFGLARAGVGQSTGTTTPPPPPPVPSPNDPDQSTLDAPTEAMAERLEVVAARPESVPPTSRAAPSTSAPPAPISLRKPLPSGAESDIDERVTLDERVTVAGAMLGTVGFMAPEQVIQRRDDARSDQFAFAITAYRTLYGKLPFASKRILSYAESLREGPTPPRSDSPVPKWIWPVLKRAMSFDAEARYPSMDALLEALEADPTLARRKRLTLVAILALAVLAAAGVVTKRRVDAHACTVAGDEILEVWTPAAATDVRAALAAAQSKVGPRMAEDTPARVVAALETYRKSWQSVRATTCHEALERGREIEGLEARRSACLDRGKEQLDALVEQLRGADEETAGAALHAVIALPRPETCAAPPANERLLPADATSRQKLLEIRKAMARTVALRLTGRPREALAQALKTVDLAIAAGDVRIEADARRRTAVLQALVGDPQAALDSAMAALSAAERGGDDAAAGLAAAFMAKTLADKLDRAKEAERWIAFAEAKLARVGQNDELEGEVLESRALALELGARLEEALPIYDRLLALEERVWGPVSERVLVVLNNEAIALASLGRSDDALALHRRGIELGEQLYGPNDLDLAIDYHNMSRILFTTGRYAEAEDAARRSYELRLVLGPTSPRLCWPLSIRAAVAIRTGNAAQALALSDQGLAIAAANEGAVSAIVPSLLIERGEALVSLGRFEEAQAACKRALSLLEHDGPLTPRKSVEEPLTCLGLATAGLGKLDEALPLLERAAALTLRDEPVSLAMTRFALARALHAAHREPERARTLAQQAESDLRKVPALAATLHEVERWLAAPFGPAAGVSAK